MYVAGLRRRSAAALLPSSWVWIPPGAWIFLSSWCCVLSGRCLCDELITRPEEAVVRRCVWSRNFVNEEALPHWGLSRQRQTICVYKCVMEYCPSTERIPNVQIFIYCVNSYVFRHPFIVIRMLSWEAQKPFFHSFTCRRFNISDCSHVVTVDVLSECYLTYLYESISRIIRPIGSRLVQETATYRCDDTRGCVMQFWHPDDEHMCSKHVEAWNKTYCEIKSL